MHLMDRSLGTLLVEQTSLARPGMDFAPQSFVIDSAKSVVHRKTAGEEKGENKCGHQLIFSKGLKHVASHSGETSWWEMVEMGVVLMDFSVW